MNKWINKCHFGDVRDVLRRMIADGVKVNCIVTSPPYWGLRRYTSGEFERVRIKESIPPEARARIDAELAATGVKPV